MVSFTNLKRYIFLSMKAPTPLPKTNELLNFVANDHVTALKVSVPASVAIWKARIEMAETCNITCNNITKW